jgi:hypothetical protein
MPPERSRARWWLRPHPLEDGCPCYNPGYFAHSNKLVASNARPSTGCRCTPCRPAAMISEQFSARWILRLSALAIPRSYTANRGVVGGLGSSVGGSGGSPFQPLVGSSQGDFAAALDVELVGFQAMECGQRMRRLSGEKTRDSEADHVGLRGVTDEGERCRAQ